MVYLGQNLGRGIKSVLFNQHLCFSSIAVLGLILALSETTEAQRRLDPALLEEYCKNFTHGDPELYQFYSPMYPREYPSNITCFRTITAEFGFFVRIDFRDVFRIEPPNNEGACEYDYLEVRDGDQGYAPLIGKQQIQKFNLVQTASRLRNSRENSRKRADSCHTTDTYLRLDGVYIKNDSF